MAEPIGVCAPHGAPAEVLCTHCGDFLCPDCVRRPPDLNLPYCAECEGRRAAHVAHQNLGDRSTALHRAALGFGLASLIPCLWFCWIGAFVTGSQALRRDPTPEQTRLAWIGIGLATLGMTGTVLMFVAAALS